MNILDDLLSNITRKLPQEVPLRSVLVGAHWTVVCSLHCGMASTLLGSQPHGHAQVRDAGRLETMTAQALAKYALSDNPLEASIGLAAINSLLDVDEDQAVEINAADMLAGQGHGKNVVLVGHFPFIPKLRLTVGQLWVIEQHPAKDEFPADAAADLLPQAQVVAVTASTLINHTLDSLLALCLPGTLVMVLGPSTPLSPLLFNHGITFLSGARVVDEAAVLHAVGQGASFQQVEGVRLLTLRNTT
jgi:uncharacterized protein (DUF4213/DUF364 family)